MEKISMFTIYNKCKVILEDENGNIRSEEFTNTTCNAGRTEIAQRLIDSITPDLGVAKYIAVGDDDTPATETDIALTNEVRREAVMLDLASNTTTVSKIYARFYRWYTLDVKEAGLFIWPDATAINGTGSMLAHSIFLAPIIKATQEIMTIERTVSIVNATI